jgi:predicted nicotinamide N-methyase
MGNQAGKLRIDVLAKNGFGKTAVGQAFESSDAETLNILLEHPSSARLNKDGSVAPKGQQSDLEKEELAETSKTCENDNNNDLQQKMTSYVKLGDCTPFPVQEIGFVRDALKLEADDKDLETTGAFLWAASLVLAQWVANSSQEFQDKSVVELGAGCALPGIATALCTSAKSVTVTELDCDTFANTEDNVARNAAAAGGSDRIKSCALDWCAPEQWPQGLANSADIIIGSDLVYEHRLVKPLLETVLALLPKQGTGIFYYVSANTNRAGCVEFVSALKGAGFSEEIVQVPESYLESPFVDSPGSSQENCTSTSPELFALRFPEIAESSFTMYRFMLVR